MRVTQSMMMNAYTSRLGKVLGNMNDATIKVETNGRRFLTAAEDPARAARAYQLRKAMQANDDYLNNVLNTLDTMDPIQQSMKLLSGAATDAYKELALRAMNDPWALEDRQIMANEIRTIMETCAYELNAKFEEKFLFGGSNTKNEPPFELIRSGMDGDGKPTWSLTFRGLDVTDPRNQEELARLADEKIYMDLGFGLTVDLDPETGKPNVKPNTAFNTAYPGIDFIGYGTDPADNFILNLGIIANLLENEFLDRDALDKHLKKLSGQQQNILIAATNLDANANFLQQRRTVLERNNDALNSKILNTEFMDMEQAISIWKMADYTYRASLEMGTKILTPSFIDFMR